MTRRPPPRHQPSHHLRRRRAIDSLLVTAVTLGLASVMAAGNAVAPKPRLESASDSPAVADRSERVSRSERALEVTVAETSAATVHAPAATRACRCQPRQPVATVPTPTAQEHSRIATSAAVTAATPSEGLGTTTAPGTTQGEAPTSSATTTPPEVTATTTPPTTTATTTSQPSPTDVTDDPDPVTEGP